MDVFIAMPFAEKFNNLFKIIKSSCFNANCDMIRADDLHQPGPIINQIFEIINESDCVVAVLDDRNPNVYYEIGIAHQMGLPTILIVNEKDLNTLPFDIRHNRVIVYEEKNIAEIEPKIIDQLKFIKSLINSNTRISNEEFLKSIYESGNDRGIDFNKIKNTVEQMTDTDNLQLKEYSKTKTNEIIFRYKGRFGENISVLIDINGIIKKIYSPIV
ncbi:MAG: hypothetical protein AB2L18_01575 [Anaerolineaceae bacterium]